MKNTVRRADVRRLALKVDFATTVSVRSAVTLWGDAWFLKHDRYTPDEGWQNAHLRSVIRDERVMKRCEFCLSRGPARASMVFRATFGLGVHEP